MRMRFTIIVLASLSCACGGGASVQDGPTTSKDGPTTCAPGPGKGDLPCDVAAVLKAKCQTCHGAPLQNNAKFAVLTYEDTRQPFGTSGKRRWQRMAEVIEPGAVPSMPKRSAELPNTPLLTAAELATLRGWFGTCAPGTDEGKGCDTGE